MLLYGSCSVRLHPGRLAVRPQHQALGLLRAEALHDARPQQPGRAHLGDLEVEVHADAPEEAQAPGEAVHVEAAIQRGLHVFLAVGQREGELQRRARAGLLHVVARDADRVELRHVPRRVLDDVRDDAHRGRRRVDVRVADHELLEDVVLDGPRELRLGHALLFRRDDVARQHRQHRAVHRHRHADAVEGDAVEEDLHVLDGVDRHAGLAHVARDARVVAVIAPVGGEIEGHADALPAGPERRAIERVGVLGGREAGVLADRPRPDGVHRGLRTAHERLEAGQRVHVGKAAGVGGREERFHGEPVRRDPIERVDPASRRRLGGRFHPLLESRLFEFGLVRHGVLLEPMDWCVAGRGPRGPPAQAQPPGRNGCRQSSGAHIFEHARPGRLDCRHARGSAAARPASRRSRIHASFCC